MMPLTKETILQYAAEYDRTRTASDKSVEEEMKAKLINQRFLTGEDFIKIGIWKSPRQKKRYESNRDEAVRELTALSFAAKTEEARLGCLLALNGVYYPLASVILHFAFPDEYPILDFRALWSLGWEQPSDYSYKFLDGLLHPPTRPRKGARHLPAHPRQSPLAILRHTPEVENIVVKD